MRRPKTDGVRFIRHRISLYKMRCKNEPLGYRKSVRANEWKKDGQMNHTRPTFGYLFLPNEKKNYPRLRRRKNDTILYKHHEMKECVKMIDDDRDQINRTTEHLSFVSEKRAVASSVAECGCCCCWCCRINRISCENGNRNCVNCVRVCVAFTEDGRRRWSVQFLLPIITIAHQLNSLLFERLHISSCLSFFRTNQPTNQSNERAYKQHFVMLSILFALSLSLSLLPRVYFSMYLPTINYSNFVFCVTEVSKLWWNSSVQKCCCLPHIVSISSLQ